MLIKKIANDTGLDAVYIRRVINSASHRYKRYEIDKNNGGKRIIQHPSKELKIIQKWVAREIISHFPVHESVYSYRANRGVSNLCDRHLSDNYLLRVDFRDFFPSIKGKNVVHLVEKNLDSLESNLSKKDIKDIRLIVCRNDELTIGAPSSPAISNAILYDLDRYINEESIKLGIKYSRYADDLYFTTKTQDKLSTVLEVLIKYIKDSKHPKLIINNEKTIYTSKKRKRIITGIVITSDGKKSVGRSKKRYIRSLVYKFVKNELSEEKISYLRGYLSYITSIEPEFIFRLNNKFGEDVIEKINKSNYIKIKK